MVTMVGMLIDDLVAAFTPPGQTPPHETAPKATENAAPQEPEEESYDFPRGGILEYVDNQPSKTVGTGDPLVSELVRELNVGPLEHF